MKKNYYRKRLHENFYCLACEMEYDKYYIFNHIQTKKHREKVLGLVKEDSFKKNYGKFILNFE